MAADIIKIMLVDDHKMIIDSLQLLFKLMDGIEVIHTIHDSRNVINALDQEMVDIVITDYRMPHLDGLQLTRLVKESFPSIKILLLTINEDSKDIQDAYHAGASGYIMKKATRKDLEEAVKTVAKGKLYFGQDALQAILAKKGEIQNTSIGIQTKLNSLTKRELEIVKLLADELSSTEVGAKLNISRGTVETHRHNILRKLSVKSTIGVIKFAIKAGIVK